MGSARNSDLSHGECAEILEKELHRRFPWIDPGKLYLPLRAKSRSQEDYCYRLMGAGKKLEGVMKRQ